MFLASCSYMLYPLVAILRKNGIPFHNPYRKTNGFWNPLRIGKKGSSANRILSLLVAASSGFILVTSGMRTAPHDPSLFARLPTGYRSDPR